MILYLLSSITQGLGFSKTNLRLFSYLFATLLVIIAGFRGDAGFDIYRYYENWWIPASNDWLAFRKEPLLHMFFGVLDNLSFQFWHAILFCSIISIILKLLVFNKISPIPFWSLIIYYNDYFYFQDMGQFRSAVAMSFVLLSYYFLIKNRLLWFFIFWMIASLTHISCLPTIIIYFISKRKKNIYSLNKIVFYLLATILFALFIPLHLALNFVFNLLNISGVYASYLLDRAGYEVSNSFGSLGEILSFFILAVCWFYFRKEKPNTTRDFFFITYFVGFLFLILSSTYGELMSRIARNFLVASAILIPFLYDCTPRNKLNYNTIFIIILFYGFLKTTLIFLKRGNEFLPHGLFS